MSEKKYTKQQEWLSAEDHVGTVGISEHAQDQLGDVVSNESAEDKAWLLKLRLSDASTDSLMSAADYQNFIKKES